MKQEKTFKKKFIIVTGPVCSGKTTVALNIAANRPGCFYFDKDDLVPTSNAVFDVGNEPRDRHSAFFKKNIRDPEYISTRDICLKGIGFNDFVIINAPYTGELKAEANGGSPALAEIHEVLEKVDAEFIVIFMKTTKEELYNRLVHRRERDPEAAKRDKSAYEDLQKYVDNYDISIPDLTHSKNIDTLFVFDTLNRDVSYAELMNKLGITEFKPYDRDIQPLKV